ncbi:MAG: hypothetical protein QOJ54_1623 [Aliidongia sp.]|jgi:hypothetical protein|nr:hypothetical protein [Aliidongia sp.]
MTVVAEPRISSRVWIDRPILIILVIASLCLDSDLYHLIWFDEMLQFAFGAYPDTGSAWAAITRSLTWINHNQTGVYFLTDFWLLKIFGASPFALRLPSLLSAAFLFSSIIIFGEGRRFSLLWKIALVAGLVAEDSLMVYAAQARPYMPLAAATVGVFAFYSTPIERRSSRMALFGLSAVLLGTLFHPYFPVYWAMILIFFYMIAVCERKFSFGLRSAVRFADGRVVTAGTIVFIIIARLSWLAVSAPQNLDPFQWIPRNQFWEVFLDTTHFEFISDPYHWVVWDPRRVVPIFMVIVAAAVPVLPLRWRNHIMPLVPPVVLMVSALVISFFLSWISYHSHYWIMARQWLASFPLVVIAVVWFFHEASRMFPHSRWSGLALLLVVLGNSTYQLHEIVPRRLVQLQPPSHSPLIPREPSPDQPRPVNEAAWVDLANQNVEAGGPVWTVFRRLYDQN